MTTIEVFFTLPSGSIGAEFIRRTCSGVLKGEKIARAHVNCVFLSDAEIKRLNSKYLKHRFPTDVISFIIEAEPSLDAELYIGLETARQQAADYKVGVREEVARLVVHGTLHLCGYDDQDVASKTAMTKKEDYYLNKFRKQGLLKS